MLDSNFCYKMSGIIEDYNHLLQELTGVKNCNGGKLWNKSNEDYYAFIPTRGICDIMRCFEDVKNYLKKACRNSDDWQPKFLDCGCGVGNIMLAAYHLNYKVSGIEYEPAVYEVAKKMFMSMRSAKVIHGDILEFGKYHLYDVIYYYVPILNGDKMKQFYDKLLNDMKVGAVVIPYGYGEGCKKSKFERVPISKTNFCSAFIKTKK